MGRPREHDEATRERLLDAAERLSAAGGFEALTVRAVAQEAGTSTRAVYALFGSKEGLEQALHQAMFTRLRDLLQGTPNTDDPEQDLVELAFSYRRWAVERPQRYALAMHRFVGRPDRARTPEGIAVSQEALEVLRGAVRRCQEAGLFPGRELDDVVVQLRATVHGLAELENLGILAPNPEAQWRSAVTAILIGLHATAPGAAAERGRAAA
jgi:AcrR family transcriptional regulator